MTLDRKGAHAALTSANLVDRADFEGLAHDIVDNLCDVLEVVANHAAKHAVEAKRSVMVRAVPVPSNETEVEKLQARQVRALEQIAYALANAKGIQ